MVRVFGSLALALGLAWGVAAQAADDWQIGTTTMRVTGYQAAVLRHRAAGLAGLASSDYLLDIGGVDLEAVAAPGAPLALRYDPVAPDGARLVVSLGSQTLRPRVFDWELRPIADFADSPYTAAVSLFGNGPDTDHFVYPRYHSAFHDTLLGLRLLQADLMLTHPVTLRAVPTRDGVPVLGAGEAMPDEAASQAASVRLDALMRRFEYQSWVLTDIGETASVVSSGAELRSTLDPFYYFWTSPVGRAALALVRLDNDAALATRAEAAVLRREMDGAARRFVALERQGVESARPVPMLDMTAAVRGQERLVAVLNPLAWDAVRVTSQYAALFRAAKAQDPAGWTTFLRAVDSARVEPAVKTPASWARE